MKQIFKNRYIKLGVIYSALTLVLIGLIIAFGLKVAVGVSELLQKNKPLDQEILTGNVLSPPQFLPILEATNSANLVIKGFSSANQKVDIYLNDLNVKTIDTDSEGKFEGNLALSLGINNIYGISKDNSGQTSEPSQTWTIYFQDSPPFLEILEPLNNSLIKRTKDIIIKGHSPIPTKVTVNEHQIVLDTQGNFEYPVRLQNGENKFKFIAVDPAQNKTEVEWTVNFQP